MTNKAVEIMCWNFDTYRDEIQSGLNQVAEMLARKRYVDAYDAMNVITQRQALTSLGMRNVLVRAGYMKGEDQT